MTGQELLVSIVHLDLRGFVLLVFDVISDDVINQLRDLGRMQLDPRLGARRRDHAMHVVDERLLLRLERLRVGARCQHDERTVLILQGAHRRLLLDAVVTRDLQQPQLLLLGEAAAD